MPGIQLNAHRLRFAIDASNPFASGILNLINGQALALPSGSALQFELLFYFQKLVDANLLDLTQYAQINIGLCANADPHNGAIYYQGTIAAVAFNGACTVEEWNDGNFNPENTHLTLVIPSANNVVPPAQTTYWIVIWAVSTDPAADDVILFASNISGKDSGIPTVPGANAGSPVKVGTKISFVCSWDNLTRDLTLVKTPNNQVTYTISAAYNGPGQASYSMQLGAGLFYDLSLVQDSGVVELSINQNGHS